MIENSFVYAMDKAIEKRRKQEEKRKVKSEKMYNILDKYNTCLPDLKKEQLTKTEYKFVIEFVTTILNCPLELYKNLA